MIEPYDAIVRRVSGMLCGLGFTRSQDTNYSALFRRDLFHLDFLAERYQSLVLSLTLSHESDDREVGAMHVIDIMEAIAPERLNEIRAIKLETKAGLSDAIYKEVEFLRDYEDEVFVRPATYRLSYEKEHRPPWARRSPDI